MTKRWGLGIGAVVFMLVLVGAAVCHPVLYRPIEVSAHGLTTGGLTYKPAPGVWSWVAIPSQYDLRTSTYTIHLWREGEHFPRIYLDATSSVGERLVLRGNGIRGSDPFFFDWSPRSPRELSVTVADSRGTIMGQHRFDIHVPARGFFVEFDAP